MSYWKDVFHNVKFPEALLAQGREKLKEADKQIVDETIYVFGFAMRESGYKPCTKPGGCVVLRQCENCKGSYSQRYVKKRHTYWACPHCETITQGRFQAALWQEQSENWLTTDKGEVVRHSQGREVYDKRYRQSYIVDTVGNLTQDDIPDYILGRVQLAQLEDAEGRRIEWINKDC